MAPESPLSTSTSMINAVTGPSAASTSAPPSAGASDSENNLNGVNDISSVDPLSVLKKSDVNDSHDSSSTIQSSSTNKSQTQQSQSESQQGQQVSTTAQTQSQSQSDNGGVTGSDTQSTVQNDPVTGKSSDASSGTVTSTSAENSTSGSTSNSASVVVESSSDRTTVNTSSCCSSDAKQCSGSSESQSSSGNQSKSNSKSKPSESDTVTAEKESDSKPAAPPQTQPAKPMGLSIFDKLVSGGLATTTHSGITDKTVIQKSSNINNNNTVTDISKALIEKETVQAAAAAAVAQQQSSQPLDAKAEFLRKMSLLSGKDLSNEPVVKPTRVTLTKGNRPVLGHEVPIYVALQDSKGYPAAQTALNQANAKNGDSVNNQALSQQNLNDRNGNRLPFEDKSGKERDGFIEYRWSRGPSIRSCYFHPHKMGRYQSIEKNYMTYCSRECLVKGWFSREALSRADIRALGLTECTEPSDFWAHVVHTPETWQVVGRDLSYCPTVDDVGHPLRLDVIPRNPVEDKKKETKTLPNESIGGSSSSTAVPKNSTTVATVANNNNNNNNNSVSVSGPVQANGKVAPHPKDLEALPQGTISITTGTVLQKPNQARCRSMLSFASYDGSWLTRQIKLLNWNVLADSLTSTRIFPYCEEYVLSSVYRRGLIVNEIKSISADLITLQEVEDDLWELLLEHLAPLGYEGSYTPKKREPLFVRGRWVMEGSGTLWRKDRFKLVDEHVCDFDDLAKTWFSDGNSSDVDKVLNRVAKGNIALVVVLEDRRIKPSSDSAYKGPNDGGHLLVVTNTHIVASTQATDVKILQSYMLVNYLSKHFSHLPLLVCGDFNSTPDSAVYELWSRGSVAPNHPDLLSKDPYGLVRSLMSKRNRNKAIGDKSDPNHNGITNILEHDLKLLSGYATVYKQEPEFTNFTESFIGTLDYIWFSCHTMSILAISAVDERSTLLEEAALPSSTRPSDHISLVCTLLFSTPGETGERSAGGGTHSEKRIREIRSQQIEMVEANINKNREALEKYRRIGPGQLPPGTHPTQGLGMLQPGQNPQQQLSQQQQQSQQQHNHLNQQTHSQQQAQHLQLHPGAGPRGGALSGQPLPHHGLPGTAPPGSQQMGPPPPPQHGVHGMHLGPGPGSHHQQIAHQQHQQAHSHQQVSAHQQQMQQQMSNQQGVHNMTQHQLQQQGVGPGPHGSEQYLHQLPPGHPHSQINPGAHGPPGSQNPGGLVHSNNHRDRSSSVPTSHRSVSGPNGQQGGPLYTIPGQPGGPGGPPGHPGGPHSNQQQQQQQQQYPQTMHAHPRLGSSAGAIPDFQSIGGGGSSGSTAMPNHNNDVNKNGATNVGGPGGGPYGTQQGSRDSNQQPQQQQPHKLNVNAASFNPYAYNSWQSTSQPPGGSGTDSEIGGPHNDHTGPPGPPQQQQQQQPQQQQTVIQKRPSLNPQAASFLPSGSTGAGGTGPELKTAQTYPGTENGQQQHGNTINGGPGGALGPGQQQQQQQQQQSHSTSMPPPPRGGPQDQQQQQHRYQATGQASNNPGSFGARAMSPGDPIGVSGAGGGVVPGPGSGPQDHTSQNSLRVQQQQQTQYHGHHLNHHHGGPGGGGHSDGLVPPPPDSEPDETGEGENNHHILNQQNQIQNNTNQNLNDSSGSGNSSAADPNSHHQSSQHQQAGGNHIQNGSGGGPGGSNNNNNRPDLMDTFLRNKRNRKGKRSDNNNSMNGQNSGGLNHNRSDLRQMMSSQQQGGGQPQQQLTRNDHNQQIQHNLSDSNNGGPPGSNNNGQTNPNRRQLDLPPNSHLALGPPGSAQHSSSALSHLNSAPALNSQNVHNTAAHQIHPAGLVHGLGGTVTTSGPPGTVPISGTHSTDLSQFRPDPRSSVGGGLGGPAGQQQIGGVPGGPGPGVGPIQPGDPRYKWRQLPGTQSTPSIKDPSQVAAAMAHSEVTGQQPGQDSVTGPGGPGLLQRPMVLQRSPKSGLTRNANLPQQVSSSPPFPPNQQQPGPGGPGQNNISNNINGPGSQQQQQPGTNNTNQPSPNNRTRIVKLDHISITGNIGQSQQAVAEAQAQARAAAAQQQAQQQQQAVSHLGPGPGPGGPGGPPHGMHNNIAVVPGTEHLVREHLVGPPGSEQVQPGNMLRHGMASSTRLPPPESMGVNSSNQKRPVDKNLAMFTNLLHNHAASQMSRESRRAS